MTLQQAIEYLRSRNLYCLDKGSKPYRPVYGSAAACGGSMINGIDSPWKSAHEEFNNEVLPFLKQYGKLIGIAAGSGDQKAKSVIEIYATLHRSFDPVTLARLKEAIKKLDITVSA